MATQTNTSLHHIIKRHMSALEDMLNTRFEDKSREIFKRMGNEILDWERSINADMPVREEVAVWNSLTDYQRRLLNVAQSKYGTSILESEPEHIREARELEAHGYLSIKQPAQTDARYYICYLTIEGRQLLNVNERAARV